MDSRVWDKEYWLPATKHEKEFEETVDWTYTCKVQYPEGQELQANCNFRLYSHFTKIEEVSIKCSQKGSYY